MSKKTLNRHCGEVIQIVVGIMISSLGLYLLYTSGIGSTPLATISDGISKILKIQRGTANIIANVALLVIALIINRNGFGKGTFITVFGIGIFINMWTLLLGDIVVETRFEFQLFYSLVGMLLNAFGLSYYVRIGAGFGPLEYITEVFYRKTKRSYRSVKTTVDITLLLIGIAIGGTYGIGTLLNVALTGIIMNFFISYKTQEEIYNENV